VAVHPVSSLSWFLRGHSVPLECWPILRREDQQTVWPEQPMKLRHERRLVGNVRENLERHNDVMTVLFEVEGHEITGDELHLRPTCSCSTEHFVGEVCRRHLAEWCEDRRHPASPASDLDDIQIGSLAGARPCLREVGLIERDLVELLLTCGSVPSIPESLFRGINRIRHIAPVRSGSPRRRHQSSRMGR